MSKNIHVGHRARVKKRYRATGLDNFEEHQALELLLFYCYQRSDTNENAHKMIAEFGSLANLLEASVEEIMNKCKVSENVAVLISLILPLNKKYSIGRWGKKIILNTTKKAGNFAASLFIGEKDECIYLICLDSSRQVIHAPLISRGIVNEAYVYPRKIVELCINLGAVSIILAHNHPSGNVTPSREDIHMTKIIKQALDPINIDILDHFIISGTEFLSFLEQDIIRNNK